MGTLQNILYYSGIFIVIASLVPLIRNDFWIFRVFEYPRLQKLTLNLLILLLYGFIFAIKSNSDYTLMVLLSLNLIYLCRQIFPFTILAKKQVVQSSKPIGERNIQLLIANVFQDNRKYDAYLQLIGNCNPDVVLMVETNQWWQDKMDGISKDYPYQMKVPLENTYGMLLYSRLELLDANVRYLVEDDIPSIETEVRLPSGELLKLFCLHPRPPVPQENPHSTERDKEILLVAKKARESQYPAIVIGDLNDVAWSYTTELFSKISELLDPRKGRGFFNSFNARYFFLRFPLDHVFCSADFTLTSIRRMNSCGSDHFPMCINLQYDPKAIAEHEIPEADQDDQELFLEKVNADTDSHE
jgi:endonuclease/exonuclease/phosphatase (EEP) superfamily protein YafD